MKKPLFFAAVFIFACGSLAVAAPSASGGSGPAASRSPADSALRIELSWDSSDFEGFEGGLVLPHRRHEAEEVLRSIRPGTSKDGSIVVGAALVGGTASWSGSSLAPGRYQFFVSDQASLQDMSTPSSLSRAGLKVTVRTKAGSQSFEPPAKAGAIWHVFDVLGEDGTIVPANAMLPWKTLVYGYVKDAVTGAPVEGARVELASKGDLSVRTASTNAEGKYVVMADFGSWKLSIVKEGYIGWKDEVDFIKAEYPAREDAHLSPPLADKQLRFVLSWGASPPDLDAHVIGPAMGGTAAGGAAGGAAGEFHISYRTMTAYAKRYFLDRDDTNGYGPETITLQNLDPGTYVFAVHDYTDRGASKGTRLSYSDAVVRVYRESQLIDEARIDEGAPGTVWRAFTIDGSSGQVELADKYFFESDPAKVR
jgi:hypothetical protein